MLPLSFMQDSRLTPHSHQLMCISITGEARVKLLKNSPHLLKDELLRTLHAVLHLPTALFAAQIRFFSYQSISYIVNIIFHILIFVNIVNTLFTIFYIIYDTWYYSLSGSCDKSAPAALLLQAGGGRSF